MERVESVLFLLMQVSVTWLQCRTWILLPPLAFGCGPPSLTLLTDRCEPLWGPSLPTTQFQMELRGRGRGRGGNKRSDETLPDVEPPPDSRWPTERAPADGGSLLRPRVEPAALQAAGLSEGEGESGEDESEQGRVKKKIFRAGRLSGIFRSNRCKRSVAPMFSRRTGFDIWPQWQHAAHLRKRTHAHTNTYALDSSRLTA